MNRALWVWKLKLCLAAAAAIVASSVAPQRSTHEHQVKDNKIKGNMVVESMNPNSPMPVPAQARQPGITDSRDGISAML